MYKCEFLSRVPSTIETRIGSSTDNLKLEDSYYGHLLNAQAKDLDFKANDKFTQRVLDSLKTDAASNFNKTSLVYRAADSTDKINGLSLNSLRTIHLLSTNKDKEAQNAVDKLLKQAITLNQGESDTKFFVVSSSAKYNTDSFSNEDINLLVANLAQGSLKKD